jgi:hypothetical protein
MASRPKFLVISGQGSWDENPPDIIVEPADTVEEANELHYNALRMGADEALIMNYTEEVGKNGGYIAAPELVDWYGVRKDPRKGKKVEEEEPETEEEEGAEEE